MAKTKKRILALVLTLAMVFTALAVTAVADEPEHSDECTINATACTCDPKEEEDGTVIHEADCGAWICVEGCGFKEARDAVAAFRTAYKDLPAEEGGVTAENAADILAAVESFKGLSSYAKILLGDAETVEANLETLEAAAKEAAEKAAADEVIWMIEALPGAEDATLDDGDAVMAALDAYDELTAEQAKLVTNAGKLDELNEALAELTVAAGAYEAAPLSIDADKTTISVGETTNLKGKKSSYKHRWTSSDTSVATVSGDTRYATVTGKSAGKVTITHEWWWYGFFEVKKGSETIQITVNGSGGSTTSGYDVHFYLLKPDKSLNDKYQASNWYYLGKGSTDKGAATNDNNYQGSQYIYLSSADWGNLTYPNSINAPAALTYNDKTYTYAASGTAPGTYTITWTRLVDSTGWTDVNSTSHDGGKPTWHMDGVTSFHDAEMVNVDFLVKDVNNSEFTTRPYVGEVPAVYSIEKDTVLAAEDIPTMSTKTVDGVTYVFDGWYTDTSCQTKADFSQLISVNTTFYGRYVECTHPHVTWTDTTEPTCTEDGSKTGTCTICGATFTESIPALDPVWGDWHNDGETGHSRVCTLCNGTATGHSEHEAHDTSIENAATATCDQAGYTGDTVCSKCDYRVEGKEIPAGHTFALDPTDGNNTTKICDKGVHYQYYVSFVSDGIEVDGKWYDKDATVIVPAYPTKTDYVFAGWDKDVMAVTAPAVYTATWEVDVIGPEDPEGTDPNKPGDDIPDKYQAVVNFKAGSNGTLKGNTTHVITLKNADGNYAEKQTVEVTGPTASANSRYDFDGWTGDAKCNSSAFKAEMKLEGGKSYTVTANFSRRSSGGGSHSGGTTIKDPEVPLGGLQLNKDDHFAYIKGYADGTVRPNNFITRAQVATIFYRLMTKETRTMYFSESNDFSDVSDDYWANKAISTLSNAGIITGFSDGTFRPNAFITRAQFAAIAARFSVVTEDLPNPFSDVPEGYWAEDLIAFAAHVGWVNGYADGTFRPTANITRAAAMKLINNVLERQVDEDGLLEDATQWNDCTPDDWCYYIVMEATNSHDWERRSKKSLVEDWTALTADPVWDE